MAFNLCSVADALSARGFEVYISPSKEEAANAVMALASDALSVGFGGSKTLAELELPTKMAAAGKEILRHGDPELTPEQKMDVMRRELTCDLFLLSANALTADGRIVNIDGNGNRVAASIFGPKKVVFVIGRNKIVDGGIDEAIARIKAEACALNCRRLNRKTPCAITGECADCDSPDRICRATVILERRPTRTPTFIILVDENLGF